MQETQNELTSLHRQLHDLKRQIFASQRRLNAAKKDVREFPLNLYWNKIMTEEQRDKLEPPIELIHKIMDRYLLYFEKLPPAEALPFQGDSIRLFKLYSPSHQALLAFYAFSSFLLAHPVYKLFRALAPWAKTECYHRGGYIDKDPMWKSEHVEG